MNRYETNKENKPKILMGKKNLGGHFSKEVLPPAKKVSTGCHHTLNRMAIF